MNGVQVRMAVQPGDGVVARFGDLAVVVGIGGDADAFSRQLLDLLAVGSADRETLWRVVALLVERRSEAPPFGLLVGRSNADRRLLLYGAVRAVVDDTELAGGEALTWLERPVPADVQRVGVTLTADGPVSADPRTDLGHGMLAGAGFVLEPVSGRPQSAAGSPPSAAPEPVAPPPPVEGHVDTAIRTPGGQTVLLADEIAHLVAEDGSRVPLDRAYVVGRDPRQDPAVRRGAASPVFVPDPELTVSRVQAYLDLEAGTLVIRDAGSSNGTDVAAPGDPEWTRLGNEPFALPVGWSIRIGRRVYTYVAPGADAPA